MIEHITCGPVLEGYKRNNDDIIHGIISLYEIPEEFANDTELFDYWWLPETKWTDEFGWVIVRPARISDEAKAQRLAKEPVHNLMTTLGIALDLTNRSVTTQGAMFPFYQITSVGNGAISGVTRADTAVAGDAFTSGARKVPTSLSVVGFQSTVITNLTSADAVGTLTNVGIYGRNVAGSSNATTSAGTGALMTHALFPFVKGAVAYSLNYIFLLQN